MFSHKNLKKVAIILGSRSDWDTIKFSSEILETFNVSHYIEIISAHRTPDQLFKFSENAENNGYKVIIAGAGGAAHLPGMIAAKTILPVLGVPIKSDHLNGIDSLYSIVQMPCGIPVGTLAIGKSGAINAALLAIQILSLYDNDLHQRLISWRKTQTNKILKNSNPKEKILYE